MTTAPATASSATFYPSFSGAVVFTEFLPKNDILNFGKLRVSWAKVGKDTGAYETNTALWPVIFSSINAGNVYNKGMGLGISGTPVQNKNFTWETGINIAEVTFGDLFR